MNILAKIIENKKLEIETQKKEMPLFSFIDKLEKGRIIEIRKIFPKNKINIIGEIKRKSPSLGVIFENQDLVETVKIYNKYCSVISVLTDKKFFGGKLEDIEKIRKFTDLPILRKDFIIDKYQIYQSRFYGTDLILLIASILDKNQIQEFLNVAKKYNLHCIVEVHTYRELEKVLKTKAEIIGINNRNLDSFDIDLNTTIKLSKKISKDKIIIAESGIMDKSDINLLKNYADGFLIGTSFLQSENIEEKINELILKNN